MPLLAEKRPIRSLSQHAARRLLVHRFHTPIPDDNRCVTVPMVKATGRILNISRDADWNEFHGKCQLGVLVCANCGADIYLKYAFGARSAAKLNPGDALIDVPEGPLHRAVKDAVSGAADHAGFSATQEVTGPGGKFRTDVIVLGGPSPIGHEIQVSNLYRGDVRRRVDLARSKGIVPAWCTQVDSNVRNTLYGRAPLTMFLSQITTTQGDIRKSRISMLHGFREVRCDWRLKREPWHPPKCTGWHVVIRDAGEIRQPQFDEFVARTAAGELAPILHRRPYQRLKATWRWVTAEQAATAAEIEPDTLWTDPIEIDPAMSSRAIESRHAPAHNRPTRAAPLRGWALFAHDNPTAPCGRCGVPAGRHEPAEIGPCVACGALTHRYGFKGGPTCAGCSTLRSATP